MSDYLFCPICSAYATRRKRILAPAIAERATHTGETAVSVLDHYMTGVHTRHLSGLPIMPSEAAS